MIKDNPLAVFIHVFGEDLQNIAHAYHHCKHSPLDTAHHMVKNFNYDKTTAAFLFELLVDKQVRNFLINY